MILFERGIRSEKQLCLTKCLVSLTERAMRTISLYILHSHLSLYSCSVNISSTDSHSVCTDR
jgi:hypothetical protein